MCQPFHPLPVSFHLRVLFPVPTSHSTLISPHQHPSISCFEIATRNSQVTPKITIITSPVLVHPLLKTLQDTGKKRKRRPHASERSRPAASSHLSLPVAPFGPFGSSGSPGLDWIGQPTRAFGTFRRHQSSPQTYIIIHSSTTPFVALSQIVLARSLSSFALFHTALL
jgi:hypothetical protein